ncbi:MAG: glycosyltransferase family 4 protein [Gemmatimonadaceae bacterium]
MRSIPRVRIVLSNASFKWGGLHVVTELLATGLQARGHEVVVFGHPGSPLEERLKGIARFEGITRRMDVLPMAIMRATAAMRRHRTQVVLALSKKDVRVTVPAAWALRIPSVIRYANDRGLGDRIYDRIFFGKMPIRHVANSMATKEMLLESAPWISPDAVDVIYNGIDPKPFEDSDEADLDLPPRAIAIGFVGSLERRKGLLDLAAAWRLIANRIPNGYLVIAGAGPAEAEARRSLEGAPRVRWLGFRSDVPAILKRLDLLVMPSHWEGFGLVAAEALLAETPVVASNASSLPEIITDTIHGLLVPRHDPESLARAMMSAVKNPVRSARMSAAGKARALAEFSAEGMIDRFERTLSTAIVNKRDEAKLQTMQAFALMAADIWLQVG